MLQKEGRDFLDTLYRPTSLSFEISPPRILFQKHIILYLEIARLAFQLRFYLNHKKKKKQKQKQKQNKTKQTNNDLQLV